MQTFECKRCRLSKPAEYFVDYNHSQKCRWCHWSGTVDKSGYTSHIPSDSVLLLQSQRSVPYIYELLRVTPCAGCGRLGVIDWFKKNGSSACLMLRAQNGLAKFILARIASKTTPRCFDCQEQFKLNDTKRNYGAASLANLYRKRAMLSSDTATKKKFWRLHFLWKQRAAREKEGRDAAVQLGRRDSPSQTTE